MNEPNELDTELAMETFGEIETTPQSDNIPEFDGIPDRLRDHVADAALAFGRERAVLCLQAVINDYFALRLINGVMTGELKMAIGVVSVQIGMDRLIEIYDKRVAALKERMAVAENPAENYRPARKSKRK